MNEGSESTAMSLALEEIKEHNRQEEAMLSDGLKKELKSVGRPAKRPRKRQYQTRAKTISIRRLSKTELKKGKVLYPEEEYWQPTSRTDCVNMERPCPYVSCKYHLFIDVHPVRGSIKLNFPDLDVWELTETCSLDVADRGGITLEEVGTIMNLTRERVRQVENTGLTKLVGSNEVEKLKDYVTP